MAVNLPILRASRRAWGCAELRNYIQSKLSESISSRSRALKPIHCYLPGHLGWSARYKNSKRDIPRESRFEPALIQVLDHVVVYIDGEYFGSKQTCHFPQALRVVVV